MNPAPTIIANVLASRSKDFLCVIEFYASTYNPSSTGFLPIDAVARFASQNTAFRYATSSLIFPDNVSVFYNREVFAMPSLNRVMGKQSNSVTVRFSNISRRLASFVLNNEIAGMYMVIRILSRANLNNPTTQLSDVSFVAFVGRCQRQDGFDRGTGSITAKQDLGQIEAQIPPRIFQKSCPLTFGGPECLGTELLTDKNAAFQTAFATFGRRGCNKTFGACTTFANQEFFQGIRVMQIPGSFLFKAHQGFFAKLFHIATFGLLFKRRKVTVDSSLEDETPYGKAIPEVLGRWQLSGIPLQFQDTGINLFWLMAWCRGPISAVLNIRNNTPGFSQPGSLTTHPGLFGNETGQEADTVFPEHGFFSRLAYTTGAVTGSKIDVTDAAPDISAMIGGVTPLRMDTAHLMNRCGGGRVNGGGMSYGILGPQWTDNPVELTAYILTDAGLLNLNPVFIETTRRAINAAYCTGAIQDDSNAERLLLPNTESSKAGTDYHRYNSTGLITKNSWGTGTGQFPHPLISHEAIYEFYDPNSPPVPADLPVKRKYRKRFSANIALTDQKKAVDFLFDTLLPSFRGFLTWNFKGQIAINIEKPPDSTLIRAATSIGATSIQLLDVVPYIQDINELGFGFQLSGQLLIGVGLLTSEVRKVTAAVYSDTAANAITLAASSTGSIVATASGATLTGGTTTVQATGRITISGSVVAGDTVTAIIDGISATYTIEAGESLGNIASGLAFAINANPTLKRYVEADDASFDVFLDIFSKLGSVTVAALENTHAIGEETIRIAMPFAGKALTYANTTKANILDGSFKYLGSNGQTRYNQFKGTFHDPLHDFSEDTLIINDEVNQEETAKVQTLDIDLSAVDNYNQASRLLNGAAAKYGDGVDFFSWSSNGLALQLEEGDVVCVNDDSGSFRNVPMRIEQIQWNERYEVSFTARIYSTSMFDDTVQERDVTLTSGLVNFAAAPPNISFNSADFPPSGLVQSTDGTAGITSIRGGAIFGNSLYSQYAYVRLIKRAGVSTNEQVAIIHPDLNNKAIFEFVASLDGLYTVELEVCNQWGCNTTKPTASIIIGFGSLFGIATEAGNLITTEAGTITEWEH